MLNLQETTRGGNNVQTDLTGTHGRVLKTLDDPTEGNFMYNSLEFESKAHRNVFLDLIRIGNGLNYTHISESTIPDLCRLSKEIVQGNQVHIVMNIGIGGIQSPASIVLPSYILGGLGYIRHIQSSINLHYPNCYPRLRIHVGMSEAIEFNGYHQQSTQLQSLKSLFILKKFLQEYFPDLENNIDFDYLAIDDDMRGKIDDIECKLETIEDPKVKDLVGVFRKMGEKHGSEKGKKNALKYAVSHIFGLQDLPHDKGRSSQKYENPYFISLGGKAERNFNHLRVLIRKDLLGKASNPNHVHLTSDLYLKPPYYADGESDILFGGEDVSPEMLDGLSKDRQIQLEQICKICNISRQDYLDFALYLSGKLKSLESDDILRFIGHDDMSEERDNIANGIGGLPGKYRHLIMDENNIISELKDIEASIKQRRFLPHDFEEKKDTVEGQIDLLKRDTVNFIGEAGLVKKIKSGKKLTVKLGIDPTGDEIHIGHLIPLKKLHLFQALGHEIRFLIGTFTATIGDPDKKSTREVLTEEQINKNIETYILQIRKVIDLDSGSAKIVYNKEWYGNWTAADLLGLAMKGKIGQMLQKEQFRERMKDGGSIAIGEFIYPLLQGWDSVILNADAELGGQDQLFNLYRGRDLQAGEEGQTPQAVITTPLLNGFDGLKMSKTYNNFVGMKPEENLQQKIDKDYGKIMSMNDEQMLTYFSYVVSTSEDEAKFIEKAIKSGLINPILVKKMLARCILGLFYEDELVKAAEGEFERVFSKRQAPSDIETREVPHLAEGYNVMSLLSLVKENNVPLSGSEIRRRVQGGAISVNNEKITGMNTVFDFKVGDKVVLKYGKGKFIQFIIK